MSYKPSIKSNLPKASRREWVGLGLYYGKDRQSICIGTKGILWGEDTVKSYPFSEIQSFQVDNDRLAFGIPEDLYTQGWVRINFKDGNWITYATVHLNLLMIMINDFISAGIVEDPELNPDQSEVDVIVKQRLRATGFIS